MIGFQLRMQESTIKELGGHYSREDNADGRAPLELEYETGQSLDQSLPIELFKLTRKIKCLPLLEPKILDDKLKRLKHKRRDIRRSARRLIR